MDKFELYLTPDEYKNFDTSASDKFKVDSTKETGVKILSGDLANLNTGRETQMATKKLIEEKKEADTSNTNVIKSPKIDLFLDNFKYLIFFLGMSIMIGTFAGEKVLNWFLILVLVGMLLINSSNFNEWRI